MLLVKEQAPRPVHILLGPPEVIYWHNHPRHQRLQLPSATVITETADRPQKQRRRDHMKQAEQANDERQARIEHVFGAADDVVAGQHGAGEIDSVDRLE